MYTEDVVSLVLGALHPRLRERCSEAKILSVLEDDPCCVPYGLDGFSKKFRVPAARESAVSFSFLRAFEPASQFLR